MKWFVVSEVLPQAQEGHIPKSLNLLIRDRTYLWIQPSDSSEHVSIRSLDQNLPQHSQ